jgi:hypothetical protein
MSWKEYLKGMAPVILGGVVSLMIGLVIYPAVKCSREGGLPVAGIGKVVCAQPFLGKEVSSHGR